MLITTSTNATTPGELPEGSFVRATLAPGPNVVVIDVKAEDGYDGQLAVKVAYCGNEGDLRTWPGEAVVDATGAFGPGDSATGAWFATIPGPGYAYVVASALASGQPDVTLRSGPGSQPGGIGTNVAALSAYRLLCSVATTFGVTCYDANGERVGDSASLLVNAGGGAAVALPAIPTGAAFVVLTHTGSSSVTLYYDTPGSTATVGDFATNYTRYPQKIALSIGTRLGR